MSKKDKIQITRSEDFSEIESELASALEQLEETNTRVESLLQAHSTRQEEPGDAPEATPDETAAVQNA